MTAQQQFENPVTIESMTLIVSCRRCGAEIAGDTEDELAEHVQTHITDVHGSDHVPPREQLLSHVREQHTPQD